MGIIDKNRIGLGRETVLSLAESPAGAEVPVAVAVDSWSDVLEPEPEDELPIDLPGDLTGPCQACGGNPMFWEDRYGAIRCCGCHPCPSRVLFVRLLVMQREVEEGGISYWFVEAGESARNPWMKGVKQ